MTTIIFIPFFFLKRDNLRRQLHQLMFSLTLQIEQFCWATSQVMDRSSACGIGLISGAFSGACSVSRRNYFAIGCSIVTKSKKWSCNQPIITRCYLKSLLIKIAMLLYDGPINLIQKLISTLMSLSPRLYNTILATPLALAKSKLAMNQQPSTLYAWMWFDLVSLANGRLTRLVSLADVFDEIIIIITRV